MILLLGKVLKIYIKCCLHRCASNKRKYKVRHAAWLENAVKCQVQKTLSGNMDILNMTCFWKRIRLSVSNIKCTWGWGAGGGDLAARMLTKVAAPLWLMWRWGTWGWGFQESSSSSHMFHCSFSSMSSVLFVKTKYSRKISSLCSTRDQETQNDEWSHDLRTCTSLHNLDKQSVALPLPPELGDSGEQCLQRAPETAEGRQKPSETHQVLSKLMGLKWGFWTSVCVASRCAEFSPGSRSNLPEKAC